MHISRLPAGNNPRADKESLRPVILSVALAVFMVRLDSYIVNISLPTISRYFHVGIADVSWVVIAYLLVMTGSMLIFGKLADRLGLKTIFIGGYVVFTLGSLFCGLAPRIYILDLARGIQGLGGAMLVTSAFAIISHDIPAEHTGWAFGICALANSLGIMVGAPLGGWITGFLSWQWVFLINLPLGITAIVIARRALPGRTTRTRKGSKAPFDFAGAVLSFAGLAALVYVLSRGRGTGWTSPTVLIAGAVALVALAAFFARERSFADPLLDFRIFKDRKFAFANLTTLLALMLLSGGNFLLPFYLELVKGLRPEHVGTVILVYSSVYMPIGLYSGKLSDRIPSALICSVATLLSLLACLAFAFTLSLPGLAPPILFLVLLAVAFGFFFAANNHLVMSLAPAEHEGAASGIYSTVMNISMILGICLFEGVFAHGLPPALSLSDFTPDQPPAMRGILIDAFRFAFTAGGFVCFLAFLSSLWAKRK